MAGTEIANAYVSLTVSMKGTKERITEELGGAQRTVANHGRTMGAVLTGAIAGAAAAATSKAISAVMGSIDGAIKRVDTLQNFPKIMKNLGFSADDASKSLAKMDKGLQGLPTRLNDMAGMVQVMAPLTGTLDEATEITLALNNAMLAGGKSTEEQSNAMAQYVQMLSVGTVDMAAWRSMQSAMPGQLDQVAKSMLGTAANSTTLYDALKSGTVSFDDMNAAIISLNKDGFADFPSFATQAKDATSGIGTSLANLQTAIVKAVATMIEKFQPAINFVIAALTDVVRGVAPFVTSVLDGAGAVIDWGKANKDWLGVLVAVAAPLTALVLALKAAQIATMAWTAITYGAAGASYASGLALKIYTLATNGQALASKAAAAAQAIFNSVMNANPILLVATAIGALVAGLVYFFTQTELGQAIWAEFTRFLGEAWANISGFFTAAWENVIEPVFNKIAEIAIWVYETILKPVFDGIAAAVQFLAAAFKVHFDAIVIAFRIVAAIAGWLWSNVLQPIFAAIGQSAKWLWENWLSPVFSAIGVGLDVMGKAFSWLYENVIRPAWDGISKAINTAWKWIDSNVFKPMKTGIDAVGKAFDAVGKFIGGVWTKIQDAAKAPVRFLINTVWNDGIRSFAVDVLKTLGLNDLAKGLKRVSLPFAQGGVLPGFTPGRDVHEFYSPTGGRLSLSGGEAIMRPEFTRAVGGPAGVARLNAMARSGQAFKDGGVFGNVGSFVGDVWDNIAGAASAAWDFLTDPVGSVKKHLSGFLSGLGGNGVFSEIVAGVPKTLLRGFEQMFQNVAPKGVGSAGMGWRAMWQIVQNAIPGVVKTSDYRPGSMTVNGGKSYHGSGRAIDLVPASMETFNAVARLFPNASELIYSPAGGRQLLNGRPFNGWSDAVRRQHYNHVHLAMANGGVVPKLYDQGGWLPHGGMAVNKSGKPEAVLTNAESRALRAGLAGGLRPGDRVVFEVEGMPFTAVAKRVVSESASSSLAVRSEFGPR
jgi:tape measure domain-containing protein